MSKLPTRPASKTAPAAPAPKSETATNASSSKTDDELKGPLQRYYGRAARLAFQLKALEDEFAQLHAREPASSKSSAYVKSLLTAYGESHTAVYNSLGILTKLHDQKWVPTKVSRGPAAGSVVQLKDFALVRFTKHGAFSAEDLKDLKVTSVHGPQVKLQTRKGDSLGLVSTGWVTKPEAA